MVPGERALRFKLCTAGGGGRFFFFFFFKWQKFWGNMKNLSVNCPGFRLWSCIQNVNISCLSDLKLIRIALESQPSGLHWIEYTFSLLMKQHLRCVRIHTFIYIYIHTHTHTHMYDADFLNAGLNDLILDVLWDTYLIQDPKTTALQKWRSHYPYDYYTIIFILLFIYKIRLWCRDTSSS